jgi:FKBP-type peptidyl-prolyl cis-trans isomerase 2
MSYPKKNDTVLLSFVGKLDNGEVFMTVEKEKPFRITIGNNDLPPTLEQEILKMQFGETRKIRVSPDEGYGPRQKELVQTIDNQLMVDSLRPRPGMIVALKVEKDGGEQKVPATVIAVEGSQVTVDYNHPLAGHHLTYDLTLLALANNDGLQ